jgi:predicted DNA binding CopG/RHH family protein
MPKGKRARMSVVRAWDDVPAFASEADEAAFWATHELDDTLLETMSPNADGALPSPRPRTKPVALRFDEHLILRAKALASRRGKGYQTLLKEFIAERLYEEERREGLVGDEIERRRRPADAEQARSTNDRHVVPASGEGWDVKRSGARRASSHHATRAAAIRRAQEIVRNAGGGEVIIRDRTAPIRDAGPVPSRRGPLPTRDRR